MTVLKWALIMAVLALVAAIFGFGGLSEGFADIAQLLFFVFLAGVVILGVLAIASYRSLK